MIYVTSSDNRISVGDDSGLDTNSGVISRLTKNGATWDKVDIVRGLPRSEENHSTNGLDLDEATNTLYVMQGGHANKGAPGNNFSGTPEYYLSAALLSVDLDAIDATRHVHRRPRRRRGRLRPADARRSDTPEHHNTIPDFPYPLGHPLYDATIDPGDPFGGNNGLNQAIPEPGGPVQIYSPGYRNAFDVVFTSQDRLYTSDNGPNGGWGGVPLTYDSSDNLIERAQARTPGAGDYCTNEFNEGGSNGHGDTLHFITGPDYYGGHPAPIRAFPGCSRVTTSKNKRQLAANGATSTSTDLLPAGLSPIRLPGRPGECEYTLERSDQVLDNVGASTNGITEYTASNFGGKLQGNILTASFNGNIYSYDLNAAGDDRRDEDGAVQRIRSQPLDVTAQGDDDVPRARSGPPPTAPTTSRCSSRSTSGPARAPTTSASTRTATASATPTRSTTAPTRARAADKPTDNDGDDVSDLNDPDDDNDTIDDIVDEFAVDPDNGLTTDIPVLRPFENNDPGTFGFFGLGLTGLMTNGTTDYLDQFDPDNLAAGGNGGSSVSRTSPRATPTRRQHAGERLPVRRQCRHLAPHRSW